MKNTLLTTTALALTGFVGSANAVEVTTGAVNLNISGFYASIFGYASVKTDGLTGADFNSLDVLTNAEIHFKPSITLDNGLKIEATIELEGNTSHSQIDQSFITFSGGFGKLIIGSKNSVGHQMALKAPDVSLIGTNASFLYAYVPYTRDLLTHTDHTEIITREMASINEDIISNNKKITTNKANIMRIFSVFIIIFN